MTRKMRWMLLYEDMTLFNSTIFDSRAKAEDAATKARRESPGDPIQIRALVWEATIPKPDEMTPDEFRAALASLGLRQIDLARLLAHPTGKKAYPAHVNRWAMATRPVPSSIITILHLLGLLSKRVREQLYREAGIKIR